MQAIEFVGELKEGIIKIPKKYISNVHKKVRVIVLIDEKEPTKEVSRAKGSKRKKFKAFKVDTKGLRFNRDEANVRSNLL